MVCPKTIIKTIQNVAEKYVSLLESVLETLYWLTTMKNTIQNIRDAGITSSRQIRSNLKRKPLKDKKFLNSRCKTIHNTPACCAFIWKCEVKTVGHWFHKTFDCWRIAYHRHALCKIQKILQNESWEKLPTFGFGCPVQQKFWSQILQLQQKTHISRQQKLHME